MQIAQSSLKATLGVYWNPTSVNRYVAKTYLLALIALTYLVIEANQNKNNYTLIYLKWYIPKVIYSYTSRHREAGPQKALRQLCPTASIHMQYLQQRLPFTHRSSQPWSPMLQTSTQLGCLTHGRPWPTEAYWYIHLRQEPIASFTWIISPI